ncbi:hypothetical protein BDV96DRAFT_654894 [Lophiotrema nucula]|uniref:Uncharacterized protein n=1 Tax=Lophiotrema nucula TaxID=690887 RepID=A0A6A5YGV1_9PLEO|nr:hypothetical protein BDV96DRAFT_654894 [Lophiotrema nucula]
MDCTFVVRLTTHKIRSVCFISIQKPGEIKIIESWNASFEWFMDVRSFQQTADDQYAHYLQVQAKKDYYKPCFEITESMYTKPREFEVCERVGGGRSGEWVYVSEDLYDVARKK